MKIHQPTLMCESVIRVKVKEGGRRVAFNHFFFTP